MSGTIFDIKEFSVHDGPASRITVFLKGCPLSCKWCHNPEGLSIKPQIMYKDALCTHCNKCYKKCNHPECQPLGRCTHICPNNCIEAVGKKYSSIELAEKLLQYSSFLKFNNGGITFSGGEPLMQADFLCEILDILNTNGIHTAVQTSGYANEETFKKVIDKLNYIMMDIKLADRELHRKYTGVYNDIILKNFNYLKKSGKEFLIRTPLIPNITDTEQNLEAIGKIIGDSPHELLKYNEFAPAKYPMLGMEYSL